MASNLMGEVDLLGLNEFGENTGLSPLYGAIIGGGVATLTTTAVEQFADPGSWVGGHSDIVGAGVGLAAAAAMYAMPATRHAALAAAAAVAVTSGVRAVAKLLFGAPQQINGAMIQNVPQVYGPHLGLPTVGPVPQVYGPGLGQAEISPVPQVYGPGLAGPQIGHQPPIDLLGEQSIGAQQATMMGGPMTSGVASAYGVTLFGSNSR